MVQDLNQVVDERHTPLATDVLSPPVRRRILRVLREAGSPLSLSDLAASLAAHQRDGERAEPPWELARQHRITLYHCHVPKLADAGLVEYDDDRRTVALADDAAERVIDQ